MVEFVIFQNNEGVIKRILAYHTKRERSATLYDTRGFNDYVAPMVHIESQGLYWTMYKLVMSLYDNIAPRTYEDSMQYFESIMGTFRVPHFDELIILEYQSLQGNVCKKELIHCEGGRESMVFNHSTLFQSDITPMFMYLRKIQSISPVNAEENLNVMKLL